MRKIFFTVIILFLSLGQAVAATLVQGEKLYADVHDCGTWYNESSTDFRLWYGEGESDYVDVEGSVEAGFLWSCDVERDDISRVQLKRVDPSNHSTVWNWSDIFDVESGKDVLKLGENCDGGCKWKTCTWYATTPIYVTPSTLTYSESATWNPETKTLKANVKVGDNPERWMTRDMTFTGKTYSGEDIYSCKLYCLYGGVHVVQFQVYNGETQEGLKEYDKEGTFTDCWSNIQNKIYNGTSWLTYGRDITIYAIPEDATHYGYGTAFDVSTHTLYANFKYGSTGSEWTDPKPTMSKTIYKYKGNWIYEVTVLAPYNVIKQIQFQVYNGESYIEEYQYDGGDCGNSTRCDLSNVTADDIDGKIFGGDVSGHTWYDYAPDTYTVEEHNDGGRIWADSVGSYTFGVGATLPTNVTKWGYDFAGWYNNPELEGDPVTAITTSDSGNKNYYAKWTPIVQEYPIAEHPEFLAAQEGDIITVNVSGVHTSAEIYLQYTNGTTIANRSLLEAGTYTFQLSAAAAAEIRTNGLLVTGQNFTFSDVDILYRKTIWTGEVDATDDWEQSDRISNDLFADLQAGDFLGVTVNKINYNKDSWHTYAIRAAWRTNIISHNMSDPGVGVDILTDELIDSLQHKDIILVSSYLSCTAIHTYTHTRVYTVEEHTNGGKINADSIGSYTFGEGTTLPTDVNKWGYKFDGWYANSSLEGDAVTTITTSDYRNKEYWAKWTSIEETILSGSNPEFLAAEEGDILVITVTNTQPRAQIYLQSTDRNTFIGSKWIAGTGAGKHVIQLTADGATALHTGVIITGENYTKSSVELFYRKTIWSGELVSPVNKVVWQTAALTHDDFTGIEDGAYVGFSVSAIEADSSYHQYNLCAYKDPNTYVAANNTTGVAGTFIDTVKTGFATHLLDKEKSVFIAAQNLTITDFYRYLTTRDYTVTLNTNGGTINAGNVTSYKYPTGATLPTNVTKTGYSFDGWYDNSSLTGSAVTTITTSDYGNKEYWAKWTPVTLTFTGDGTSFDWFKTSCWSPACIPTIEHDVIIQNKATLYGPYGTGATYNTGDATTRHAKAKSIVIDKAASENAKIEIWSKASLIVAEDITVKKEVEGEVAEGQPTTPADLKMETSVLGNGGLICGSRSTTTQATYEFYSKAYKNGRWYINQYVGIPFSSMDAYQLYGFNIYEYNDEKDIWTTPTNSTMVPWKAYNPIRKYSGSGSDYDLTGTLNLPGTAGDGRLKDLNCAWRTGEGIPASIDKEDGHQDYMFANSWTAPIHIASMTTSDFTNMVATIYIFNAGYVDPNNSQKELGDLAGQWSSFPIAAAAAGEIDNAVIPATQAFCVTATAENAKLRLDYKKHVYDPAIDADSISIFPTRAPKRNQEEMPLSKIRMMVLKDTTMADQLYLFERDDFNDGFDNGWDGHKVFGNATAPQLYTKHGNANFAVDAVPDLEGTVIGFQKGSEDSEYTFSFEYKGTATWYLNDLKAQKSMLISAGNTYEFTAEDDDAEARFIISATPIANLLTGVEQTSDSTQDAKVRKVLINDHIYIIRSGRMYDVTGKLAQ